ncbi:pre-mRNA processing RNA-helicase [Phlyctochytrium planicorne]|nr:pre-mRNA processing RNA-helicase [Phlyctochytrium planicorne]
MGRSRSRSRTPERKKKKDKEHRSRHRSRDRDRDRDRDRERDRKERERSRDRDRDAREKDDDRRRRDDERRHKPSRDEERKSHRSSKDDEKDRDRDRDKRDRKRQRVDNEEEELRHPKETHDKEIPMTSISVSHQSNGAKRDDHLMDIDSPVKPPMESVTEVTSEPQVDGPTASGVLREAQEDAPRPPPLSLKPNEVGVLFAELKVSTPPKDSIRSVMESMSVEEKTRQRRERVEKWRREKLAKEQADLGTTEAPEALSTAENASAEVVEDESQKKGWSLEDDDEDDLAAQAANNSGMWARCLTMPINCGITVKEKAEPPLPATVAFPPLRPLGEPKDEGDFLSKGFPNKEAKPIVFSSAKIKPMAPKSFNQLKLAKPVIFSSSATTSVPLKPSGVTFDAGEEEASKLFETKRSKKLSFLKDTIMSDAKPAPEKKSAIVDGGDDDDDEDALDAFMMEVTTEVKKLQEEDLKLLNSANGPEDVMETEEIIGEARILGDEDEDSFDDGDDIMEAAAKKLAAKRKDLATVDHSTISYEPFQKNFYIEPPEIATLTTAEVDIKRAELGGIKIRGVNCPKPIERWAQMGLPPVVFEVIRKVLKYEKPTAIQAQSIPAIMSGRDVIGIAKTGSGKTISFLLPMLRHIKSQRPVELGEGPVALIMTPTRELAVQIHKDARPFIKSMNLKAVCCYGGSPIKDQIAELKRGAEVIICTPGRMIDLLCANSGRVTNLKRVTYLILDEADRMFDMGFEPQVMKMVGNIRPDRQTILFSATFPKKMEALARKILKQPLEITVGGRSVVCADVHQIVEVFNEDSAKFLRLLEILGLLMSSDADAKVLIFVERQEGADHLLRDLLRRGYPCQTLHGGKDQADRESTIADFKSGIVNVVIATSVAARGLDVKQLKVVINYDVPNHMEDYVHRCGRTGRAGNKGTAYTFITTEQEKFSVDIVQALKMSNAAVPDELQNLADAFIAKVKDGKANYTSSGFGGKGLDKLEKERDIVKKIQKKSMGSEYVDEDAEVMFSDDDEEGPDGFEFNVKSVKATVPSVDKEREKKVVEAAEQLKKMAEEAAASGTVNEDELKRVKEAINKANATVAIQGLSKVKDVIANINRKYKKEGARNAGDSPFAYEFEINDFPQKARWKVTNKEQITQITEMSGAAVTTRGTFFPPGKQPAAGERKLFLFIEGETQLSIDIARREIKRILKEETMMAIETGQLNSGRYLVTL